ncbi:MAG: DUF1786 domain-containing protein [Chloroflexi bacterium]|nr:DUF1786 domain-containing protein [Chloroflexota bacterium]
MQILTVDIGTGTQDVLLFDSERELENCYKLVLPSPTVVIADRIRAATAARKRLVLHGVTMGGGPSHWATLDHVRAGLEAFATPDAARTFDDDLDRVDLMGIRVVSDDEAMILTDAGAERVFLRDLALGQILQTLAAFGVHVHLDGLAVAVFDHGAAPPGLSDRIFRFDYLRARLAQGLGLGGFAFPRQDVPPSMTRLQLAFHFVDRQVVGLFEHHTGELTSARLLEYIEQLGAGSITNELVFADKGHGALVFDRDAPPPDLLAVTGPRRTLLVDSGAQPHLAVPHGDMMLTGNFGLLRACAAHDPEVRQAVEHRLGRGPEAPT